MNNIFPSNASFALFLAGPFISAVVAYYGLHFSLAVLEWFIDRVAAAWEAMDNRLGGGGDDDGFEGYADMELPEIDGVTAEARPSLHRRTA